MIDRFEVPKNLALSSLAINSTASAGMALTQSSNVFAASQSVSGLSNSAFANGDHFLRTAYFQ